LSDRVAVVTGGASGIGLATALLLAEGARVAICGRDEARLASARDKLAADGDRVLGVRCDVLSETEVGAFAARVGEWSGGAVDLLVNNAGQGRVSTFASTSDADWRQGLELKFFSQILPIRAFRPLLERPRAPWVVGVNSPLVYQPEPHMVCTSAARAGAQNLLKSLAVEFAPAIRVNSVLLGLVDSGRWQPRFEARTDKAQTSEAWFSDLAQSKGIPLGRLGSPEEPARAIVFLGSPAASYITGASLEISGGVSTLAELGVTVMFGVISIHNMPILDAVARQARIRFVPARGEAGAMNMADAYARVSRTLGVALTSTGVAAGNPAGSQVEALTAGSPVLHITTQVDRAFMDRDRAAIHDAPRQADMLKAISKSYLRVWEPARMSICTCPMARSGNTRFAAIPPTASTTASACARWRTVACRPSSITRCGRARSSTSAWRATIFRLRPRAVICSLREGSASRRCCR
jgi:NAD(P)-dependent dehydrogenase (short-subunit alcohol dehydrogenase family)